MVDDRVDGAERWGRASRSRSRSSTTPGSSSSSRAPTACRARCSRCFGEDLRRATNTTLADLTDGNLGEDGTLALGVTNALYADVDGEPGFNPPRTP